MKYIEFIYPLIYIIIILFGILNFKKVKNNFYLKLFLTFLVYSLVTEIMGYFIGVVYRKNTSFIYNLWNFLNSYFYFFFFLSLIKNTFKRNIIKTIIVIYSIISIIDITFYNNFIEIGLNANVIIGSTFIVIVVMLYFTELLKSEAVLGLNTSIYFWISLGVLFFNIGMIPIFVIARMIKYRGVWDVIILSLNLIMAGFFITGFILSKKEYNK